MSIPNTIGKHAFKAVIEPVRVMEERKKHGLYPSCPIPDGAVICYNEFLWQWVCSLPGRVDCDGWLKGAYLLPYEDQWVLAMKAAGYGAPTAVMTLEELIGFGITVFVNLGTAGGLQETMSIGDIVVCERAIRDEGTSYHYLPDAKYAYACPDLTAGLHAAIKSKDLPVLTGTSWTTDAPYRETMEEVRLYRAEGVATVEMEAAALFSVGEYRGTSVCSIFAVSDMLLEDGWTHGFQTQELTTRLTQIFEVALQTIAARNGASVRP